MIQEPGIPGGVKVPKTATGDYDIKKRGTIRVAYSYPMPEGYDNQETS